MENKQNNCCYYHQHEQNVTTYEITYAEIFNDCPLVTNGTIEIMESTCFQNGVTTICEVANTDYEEEYFCGRTLKRNPYALKAFSIIEGVDCFIYFLLLIYMLITYKKWCFIGKCKKYQRLQEEMFANVDSEEHISLL